MKLTETINTMPISVEKSLRKEQINNGTSNNAGKIIPIKAFPLLREDRVSSSRMRLKVQMAETAEVLMNAINVTAHVHFIPFLAFERFNGMDSFNRSYKGEPEGEGLDPIPFFETHPYDRANPIYKSLGMHAKQGTLVNTSILESYNVMVNHRLSARSTKLTQRLKGDTSIASAFWHHTRMAHIVPDFDQAMIDGEVPLNIAEAKMPVKGIGRQVGNINNSHTNISVYDSSEPFSPAVVYDKAMYGAATGALFTEMDEYGRPQVFAEMEQSGITVSLANIEKAKQMTSFAKLRSQYSGLDDDHIIDLLMEGVRVPEEQLSQPILLTKQSTIMGYNQRYATDSGNLDESVTTGETFLDLVFRTPAMNTGGIVFVTMEITPEQLFERQKYHFFHATSVDHLPNFTRDFLDPEKVDIVQNSHVDVDHDTPDATFGYAPLNHAWQRAIPGIGGKFFRPEVDDPFDEDRQRIWAVETQNPTLTEDFYLCNGIHQNVFADTQSDAFEITALGQADIVGNTVFGKGLIEDNGDYEAISEDVDDSRIDQDE